MRNRSVCVEALETRWHLDAVPYHLQLAEQLVANILPANNVYAYGAPSVTWAGLNGSTIYSNRSDCSTFDVSLLTAAYHFTSSQFIQWTGESEPQASALYNAAIADDGFTAYKNVASVEPGDDMFIKFLDSTTDTGHVVTIVSAPTLVSTTATQRAYNLTIIDSTADRHSNDTRVAGETGVGEGTMRIYTDSAGNLTSYAWGTSASSVIETSATRPATFAKIPPTAVAAPTALCVTTAAASSVSLQWTSAAANADGFVVQRSSNGGASFSTVGNVAKTVDSFTDTTVKPSTAYVYRVYATYGSIVSAFSNTVAVTTPAAIPPAPTDFTSVAHTGLTDVLTWAESGSGETGFTVQRSVNGSSFTTVATLGSSTRTWTDSKLTAGAKYTYRIRAFNTAGASAWTTSATEVALAPLKALALPELELTLV